MNPYFTVKQKSIIYDLLYDHADEWLEYYDPCEWENGQCKVNRSKTTLWKESGCCWNGDCRHLEKGKGCKVRALGCKLFFCSVVDGDKKYIELQSRLDILRTIALRLDIYPACDMSKQEFFSRKSRERLINESNKK